MTSAPIPFTNQQESGSDELGGASSLAMNVILDQKGTVRRRPGLATSSLAPAAAISSYAIIGVWVTQDGKLFAVDAARNIYRVTPNAAAILSAQRGSSARLNGDRRPVFAETEALIAISGGQEIQKIVLATNDTTHLGGNPPMASHVIANSARLLANDINDYTGLVRFSDFAAGGAYAGHEVWNVGIGNAGYFSTESRPDPVVALVESSNEIVVFGTSTMQAFAPDAQSGYAPVSSREFGCSAPYSVIRDDNNLAFFDNARRMVVTDTRDMSPISGAIKGTLDAMRRTDDAFGYRALVGSLDSYAWTFPTDGRTFNYQKGGGWSQWSGGETNARRPFPVSAHCISPLDGRNVVGTLDGRIAELSGSATTDLGVTFSSRVVTGFLNHDTDNRKHCACVRFALRRGEGTGPAFAKFGYRDAPGDWLAEILIPLGSYGETDITIPFRSLGTYRRRQWFFEFGGSRQLVLAGATEEYEVLDS